MTSVVYTPATPFPAPEDHPNRKAHEWVTSQLDGLNWGSNVDHGWIRRQGEPLLVSLTSNPEPSR